MTMAGFTVSPNGVYKLKCVATDSDGNETSPAVSDWVLSGNTDTRSSVDNEGVLKIGPAEAGSLTVSVTGGGKTGTLAATVNPHGAPYWPGQAPTPPTPPAPTPAVVTLKVADTNGDPVTSPLPAASRYSVVLRSTGELPGDAKVEVTASTEQVTMYAIVHEDDVLGYMMSISPTAPDEATIELEASGTGFETIVKNFVVSNEG